ncbi:MAG: Npt1/Npt2 family nucleotide transporter [Phycisphaerales bacterium]
MNGAGDRGRGGGTPVGRLLSVRPGEWGGLLLSGVFFFLLLFGYFLLRPVREAMGVQRSMTDLRWLFVVTCVVSLAVTLAFGDVVRRMDRRRFIAVAYRAVIACLLVFIALRVGFGDEVKRWAGYAFYVWLSVVNLFMVSVFWAFMADVWRLDQGKRLYAAIGVGGTLGALAGSSFAWQMAEAVGAPVQMALAAVLFEGAVWVMRALDRRSTRRAREGLIGHERHALGGSWWEGAGELARSPYLLGVGAYIVLIAVSSTLLYFTQAHVVVDAADELRERISLFGQLDVWTQVATLLVQLFVTGHLMRRAGVGVTLGVLPVVTVVGFGVLALVAGRADAPAWQTFAVFAAFNAAHRATRYAVARPARETLFNVVPESEKYKAKPIVDVFLFRGGDVAGIGVEKALAGAGLALGGMALAAAPVGVLWIVLSLWLAGRQRAQASERHPSPFMEPEPGSAPEGATT